MDSNLITQDKNISVWMEEYSKKYDEILQHWKEHGDPLKRGLALLVLGGGVL